MKTSQGKLKVCSRGHRFQKSSDCPVCPICWPGQRKKLKSDFPKAVTTVDEYIATAPQEVQGNLKELRVAIKSAAPLAEERISYGMVGYFYLGKLIYFGLWKDHIGLYPIIGDVGGLEKYRTSKGTASFPLDKKLPVAQIKKLVKERVKRNEKLYKKKK